MVFSGMAHNKMENGPLYAVKNQGTVFYALGNIDDTAFRDRIGLLFIPELDFAAQIRGLSGSDPKRVTISSYSWEWDFASMTIFSDFGQTQAISLKNGAPFTLVSSNLYKSVPMSSF